MSSLKRRQFLKTLFLTPLSLSLFLPAAKAMDCNVLHPLMPPQTQFQGQCPVCGMVRPMWARTWIRFKPFQGVEQVCSFHCLADWSIKTGQTPTDIMLAVYHTPEKMIPADKAFVVLGSTAAGTMSPVSKIVFDDKTKAVEFAEHCGGEVVDFQGALAAAKSSVLKENKMVKARQLKKGKIVEPSETDRCPVCNMFPARYPYGKCQIQIKSGKTFHFCSTQCLFAFMGKQSLYVDTPVEPFLIWVVDRNSGMWTSGRTAFYVIGSSKVFGPMGYEAFPFNSIAESSAFAAENGGTAVGYGEVSVEKIVPGWRYPPKVLKTTE
ncbi:nitrous oxide reductase accessory protein NosL [Desulfobacter sp.]|uniref:nitrous oxide reductase accessory protein NosL n=1 Tax=Desulfobacter sp. TaxID=2294 RepID=UPI00257D4C2D|nr:nitrous oxide reductase accessory protein NosL [Desulfobacter sp.]